MRPSRLPLPAARDRPLAGGCPPASPPHQVQRPEEEVQELGRAGVLDVLLQLGLRAGGTG